MDQPQGYHCPGCGEPSGLSVGTNQSECGNEDCSVFIWNPTKTLAELVAGAHFAPFPFDVDEAAR